MNKTFNIRIGVLLPALLAVALATVRADIEVGLSVKFIHNNDLFGSPPLSGVLGNSTGFAAELAKANAVLEATGRGYSLRVIEYVEIQPPAPVGQTSDYWFSLPARSNRQTIEDAALAAKAVWAWNDGAINFYVNNSTSGQCSFVGTGASISLGSNLRYSAWAASLPSSAPSHASLAPASRPTSRAVFIRRVATPLRRKTTSVSTSSM